MFAKQSNIKYAITGDFPAPHFFAIDADSGRISLQNDLMNDKGFSYLVWVDDMNKMVALLTSFIFYFLL